MGKMSEFDFGFDRVRKFRKFGFENSKSEPIGRNCRFDHLSAKHFRFEDSAREPIQRSVFATPFAHTKEKNLIKRCNSSGFTRRGDVSEAVPYKMQ